MDDAAAQFETVWLDANRFYDAESRFEEVDVEEYRRRSNHSNNDDLPVITGTASFASLSPGSSLASEIEYARQRIQKFLKSSEQNRIEATSSTVLLRINNMEETQAEIKQHVEGLSAQLQAIRGTMDQLDQLVKDLPKKVFQFMEDNQDKITECILTGANPKEFFAKCNFKYNETVTPAAAPADNNDPDPADDDDIDLFNSDEEDESSVKLREERIKECAAKKAKKPALVAKSSVVLDVKPWDDETDMKAMEKAVRSIETSGLVWGASKLVPLAYGINKLQIVAIVEDDKVSIDWLQETICDFEDMVQSVDIAAFNKL